MTDIPQTAEPPVAAAPATPPDWASTQHELQCPLCNYNLRGLTQPRCPECGFTFSWEELLTAQRNRHPYLFEHQPKHNIRSFWKTFWTDCRPRKFWRELSPANPVRIGRLLLYWFLANVILLGIFAAPIPTAAWRVYVRSTSMRKLYVPVPGSNGTLFTPTSQNIAYGATPGTFSSNWLDQAAPLPTSLYFWREIFNGFWWMRSGLVLGFINILLWPWVTLLSLLLFQASMRRARINKVHVLRAAIYSSDLPLLVTAIYLIVLTLAGPLSYAGVAFSPIYRIGWSFSLPPEFVALICTAVVLYRLTICYRRYMRFHLPFLTVLASQVIVFLAIFTLQLNI